ncbi:MAG: metallophosphoesterase family protein [Ignavibacteriaceae bacterium]
MSVIQTLSLIFLLYASCSKFPEKNISTGEEPKHDRHIRNVTLKSDLIKTDLIESGPIVGAVTESSATFLLKTSDDSKIRIQLSLDSAFNDPFYSEEISTDKKTFNYTKIEIKDLTPGTKYFYRAIVNENITDRSHYFKTFSVNKNHNFSFGFGSCQQGRSTPTPDIFPVIAKDSLRFFIHLGDWTYPDFKLGKNFNSDWSKLEESYKIKYDYSYPFVSEVLSKMPIAYTYDDHEYAGNDADGTNPFKNNSVKGYSMFFPHYKMENPENGIWQKFKFGDVEFFLLDLRTQRNSNDSVFDSVGNFSPPAGHSILSGFKIDGVDQKTWLENSLKNSDAKWKVIVSSVIFNPRYLDALKDERITKSFPKIQQGVVDKWAGFPEDINFLINLVKDNNLKNIIIISGDSHSSYIDDGTNSVIPEISSSSLDTRNSKLGLYTALTGYNIWNQGSYNEDGDAYGRISFYFGEEEYALLEIIDQTGKSVISYKLNAK